MKPSTLRNKIAFVILLLMYSGSFFSQTINFSIADDYLSFIENTNEEKVSELPGEKLTDNSGKAGLNNEAPFAAPSNDNCNNSISLTSNTTCTNIQYTLDQATPSGSIPLGCATAGIYYDVWFSFTAVNSSHTVNISGLAGNTTITNPKIQLYGGPCGTLASVQCGNTTLTATGLIVTSTYYIRVSNLNSDPSGTGSKTKFDICVTHPAPLSIDRGPYIQVVNETEATLRWRTTAATDSRVQVGTSQGVYTIIANDATSTTQHIVRVTGLNPDTKYFYSVGSSANPTMGGHATDYYFGTAAQQNTTRKLKFAVFGDCGRNDLSFRTQSIGAYQNYMGATTADALLLLGDNAYNSGLESEYNTGFFQPMSSTMLKNHPLFTSPGNHDYYGTSQSVRTGEYYQAFSMPTNAECGGVASNSKSYYSWNYGDVHFLSLDSYGTETASNLRLYDTLGPQVTWLKSDLAANTRKWTVAYWHHPPYTEGSHNSNSETELINIRYNFIRILERMGVDLILCGHSHDYERSRLLNGHYGTEIATAAMTPYLVSNSTGMYNGSANSCVYTTASNTQNHGTVYVVAGSSGADGGTNAGLDGYPHNALPHSIDDGGMFYFEVDGNRLDAKFLRRNNTIGDQFTIMKDVNKTTNYTIGNGSSQTLTASWPGNYSWSTTATTKSVSVTPPANAITNYTVSDGFGCLTDQFSITTSNLLPVQLRDYAVNLNQEKVFVDWTTTTEINNRLFTIERSADARHFETVGTVNGAGNADALKTYQFIDPAPLEGLSFYRLSQTNQDGTVKYFDIKRIVNKKETVFYADAYQSGAQKITMQLYTQKAQQIQLSVIDFGGRVIKKETWGLYTGSNNKTIDLKNGNYILEWKKENGEAVSQKIIVK
ncbi:MAG: metallophosphoesterase [Chitinophagaceae bacterium]